MEQLRWLMNSMICITSIISPISIYLSGFYFHSMLRFKYLVTDKDLKSDTPLKRRTPLRIRVIVLDKNRKEKYLVEYPYFIYSFIS